MALQGTLSDFGLDEVLRMLELGKKLGRLRVTGGPGETTGNLWVDDGRIVGSALAAEPASGDHVEALFQLLRLDQGEFHFHGDESVTVAEGPEAISEVLEAATARLAEWRELAKVLPSQEHWLSLSASIPTAVTVEPAQWAVLATVGSGMQVSQCVEEVGLGLVPSCRVIVELVDRSLVTVDEEVPPRFVEVVGRVEPQLPSVGAADASELEQVASAEASPAPEVTDPTPETASSDEAEEPAPGDVADETASEEAPEGETADEGEAPAEDVAPDDDDVNPRALLRLLNSVK